MHCTKSGRPSAILGISFDGLSISGIVNEFLGVAASIRGERWRVLLDLGYDITLGRTANFGDGCLPDWVEGVRCLGSTLPPEDTARTVDQAILETRRGVAVSTTGAYADLCSRLSRRLEETFTRDQVRLLVVENGTLPDNPLFTEALYRAIERYGKSQRLPKYVLWRDHDLMWSTEPHLYGEYPYPGVRKPTASPYIHYAVSTQWMKRRMQAWAPSAEYHIMPNRFFTSEIAENSRSVRATYNIPEDAILVARCTRIVPQKCVERDLRLLAALQARLIALGSRKRVFLFVTGPIEEDLGEYRRLCELEAQLSLKGRIIWGNGLLPFSPLLTQSERTTLPSVRRLLGEADLSSFLTSYDYEGFGNPPGEAMATGVPFIATTYELYHEVYGSKGAVAPLLPITRRSSSDGSFSSEFLDWTLETILNVGYRTQITTMNRAVCRRFFSLDSLSEQLHILFGEVLGNIAA